ncbi:MAG: Stp1/IreP family PP2C-type Ser/Thr phosphatase [Nitrospirae bacterium]|nr:Stp1/IreP family PP2C-type Ser/Thr phosphatase [Nitrospirota bacterium]
MQIKAFGQSDVGRVRSSNEDAWGVFPDLRFFIVADGMGGHAAGEVASHMAVDTMRDFIQTTAQSSEITWPVDVDRNLSLPAKRLVAAGKLANEKIYQTSRSNPKLAGMGTTMVAGLIDEDIAYIAHAGDSRAYLIRDDKIQQLTQDHSLINDYITQGLLKMEEAGQHPLRHVITRALGSNAKIDVDLKTVPLVHGDAFLLCSDGLSNLLTEEEMRLNRPGSPEDLPAACQRLIELANKKGGEDNITVVLISGTRS